MKYFITTILLLAALTGIEFRAVSVMHGLNNWNSFIPNFAYGIAMREYDPGVHYAQRWIVAKVVLACSGGSPIGFINAWFTAVALSMFATNSLAYWLAFRLTNDAGKSAGIAIAQAAVFVCAQEVYILGSYDLPEMGLWLLLAYFIWTRSGWWRYLVLLLVGLHNRETSLFFPAWVAIEHLLPLKRSLKRWIIGAVAAVCMPIGMLYTEWMRYKLAKLPHIVRTDYWHGECMNWQNNWRCLKSVFSGPWAGHPMSAATSATLTDMWATLFWMVVTLISCCWMPAGWFRWRLVAFLILWWSVCWFSVVITEQRSITTIAPILIFALFGVKQSEQNENQPR